VDTWYCKDLGNRVAAFEASSKIQKAFLELAKNGGQSFKIVLDITVVL